MKKYFQAPWRTKDVLIVLLIVIVAVVALNFGLSKFGLDEILKTFLKDSNSGYKTITVVGVFMVQSLILMLPLLILSIRKEGSFKWRELGFSRGGIWKSLLPAFVGYLSYVGISIVITATVLLSGIKIPGYQIQAPIIPVFGESGPALFVAGIIVLFVAPFVEEIFFRGFMLQGFVNDLGKYVGAILTAVLFAAFHLEFGSFIPVIILGIILSVLFIRSKSIWPCLWFHLINNTVAFVMQILIVKQIIQLDF